MQLQLDPFHVNSVDVSSSFTHKIKPEILIRIGQYASFPSLIHLRQVDSRTRALFADLKLMTEAYFKQHGDTLRRRYTVDSEPRYLNFCVQASRDSCPEDISMKSFGQHLLIAFSANKQEIYLEKRLTGLPAKTETLTNVLWIGLSQKIAFIWSLVSCHLIRVDLKEGLRFKPLEMLLEGEDKLSKEQQEKLDNVKKSFKISTRFYLQDCMLYALANNGQINAFKISEKDLKLVKHHQLSLKSPSSVIQSVLGPVNPKDKFSLLIQKRWIVTFDRGFALKEADLKQIQERSKEAPEAAFFEIAYILDNPFLVAYSMHESGLEKHWTMPLQRRPSSTNKNISLNTNLLSDDRFVVAISQYGEPEVDFPVNIEAFDKKTGLLILQLLDFKNMRTLNDVWLERGILCIANDNTDILCWDLNSGEGQWLGQLRCRLLGSPYIVEVYPLSEKEICVLTTNQSNKNYQSNLAIYFPPELPDPVSQDPPRKRQRRGRRR